MRVKFKRLWWLIKFWYRNISVDSYSALELMEWELKYLYKNMEKYDVHVGQKRDMKNLKIFLETLKRLREDNFNSMKEKNSNMGVMVHYFRKINSWWI